MKSFRERLAVGLGLTLALTAVTAQAQWVGDVGPMYESLDENMQLVNMAELIVGKPLVLAVGSAS